MKKYFCFLVLFSTSFFAQTEIKVSSGKIVVLPEFESKFVFAREIYVWLPENYSEKDRYDVLYMHDAQMLFDATNTWNKQEWDVDTVLGKLIANKDIRKTIVVAIPNNGDFRHSEFFPEKIIKYIPEKTRKIILEKQLNNSAQADNYLQFIVKELKPRIDKKYKTFTDKYHTFIAGSSMGGLISLYAVCEYPEVFGGCASLSIHSVMVGSNYDKSFNIETDVASKFRDYLATKIPNLLNHKIYIDYGDQTIDAFYKPFHEKLNLLFVEKGFTNTNFRSLFFPGADHSEKSWNERLDIPMKYLLGKH